MQKPKNRSRRQTGTDPSPPEGSALDLRSIEALVAMLGGAQQNDAADTAQGIMYDAWETGDQRRRIALAKKALKTSPLCADAYVLLAREAARNPDEAIGLYRQGVEAGEKMLGKASFREDVGQFWGILETRPYMRARHGLAQALWDNSHRDEAVTHFQAILDLNPNDNQGIRYVLLDCLLTLGRDHEAAELIERYSEDGSAAWIWSRALLEFRRNGDAAKSRAALSQAMSDNEHVAPLLLGDRTMPRRLPAYVSWGGKDEAVAYVHGAAAGWAAADGALAWLRAHKGR